MSQQERPADTESARDSVLGALKRYLDELLQLVEPAAHADVQRKGRDVLVHLTHCPAFAEREAAVIQSLEHLLELHVRRAVGDESRVEVDIAGFRQRRCQELLQLSQQLAQQAQQQGKAVPMDPMTAWERKVVHESLEGSKFVRTYSRGDVERRLVIEPLTQKTRPS